MVNVCDHQWRSPLVANYRQCAQCRRVEVLVDGQWVLPSSNRRGFPGAAPATLSWDVEAKEPVREVRQSESLLNVDKSLGGDWHRERVYRLAGEAEWRGMILKFQIDERIQYESSYIISDGEQEWRKFAETASFNMIIRAMNAFGPVKIIQAEKRVVAASENRAARERLLLRAKRCQWVKLSFGSIMIEAGVKEWSDFAQKAEYEAVVQGISALEQWLLDEVKTL